MYQQIIAIGRLGRDPSSHQTLDGTQKCDFSLAINERRKDGEKVTWLQVTCFGKLAEICLNAIGQGSMVLVAGRLDPSLRTGSPKVWWREDEPYANYDVIADTVEFL